MKLLGGLGNLIVGIYKEANISAFLRQVGGEQGGYTGGSLFDVLVSVVDGLLSGIDITLLARLCARRVGDLLG